MRKTPGQGQLVYRLDKNSYMASKPDILLVDDDERLRNAAGKCSPPEATASPWPLPAGSTGDVESDVALVVSDLRLPDLDGIALFEDDP